MAECLTRTVDEHLAERAVSEERKLLIEIADVIAVSSSLGESAWWRRMEKRLAAIGIEV
jgi:hypothetical protein